MNKKTLYLLSDKPLDNNEIDEMLIPFCSKTTGEHKVKKDVMINHWKKVVEKIKRNCYDEYMRDKETYVLSEDQYPYVFREFLDNYFPKRLNYTDDDIINELSITHPRTEDGNYFIINKNEEKIFDKYDIELSNLLKSKEESFVIQCDYILEYPYLRNVNNIELFCSAGDEDIFINIINIYIE